MIAINITILVVAFYIDNGDSTYYGNIIRIETQEWSKSPIISIVNPSNNEKCPNQTEVITGTFYGINVRCNYINGTYRVGTCDKGEGLYT